MGNKVLKIAVLTMLALAVLGIAVHAALMMACGLYWLGAVEYALIFLTMIIGLVSTTNIRKGKTK